MSTLYQHYNTALQQLSMGLLRAAICLPLLVLLASGCSSRAGNTEQDDALSLLRDRMDRMDDEGDDESQDLAEYVPQSDSESLLLVPRYYGSLPDDDPLVLGVFPLRTHRDPIIDGDTVAVDRLDASLRLLSLDTEEVFHGNDDLRQRAYSDFEDYVNQIYADDDSVPKFATPMGEIAAEYAHQFFEGDTSVRLELDDIRRTQGYFGRYLVYIFTLRDGQWVNYNVEAVRAGMSPYFTKYGYSRRFHAEFLEAENEAREAHRGVWNPDLRHYPDYEDRRVWWDRRADAIFHFQETYADDPTYFDIGTTHDWERLSEYEGQRITVFGTLSNFHYDWDPQRVTMSHRRGEDFSMVGFRDSVFEMYNLEQFQGEYLYVRGELGFYNGRPQFVVDNGIDASIDPE